MALIVLVPLILAGRRQLDLLSLDDDAPRLLGVPLERTRLLHLGGALRTAASVSAIGAPYFIYLLWRTRD